MQRELFSPPAIQSMFVCATGAVCLLVGCPRHGAKGVEQCAVASGYLDERQPKWARMAGKGNRFG